MTDPDRRPLRLASSPSCAVQDQAGHPGTDPPRRPCALALLKPVEDWDEAGFDRVFDTNVKGPYFLLQALLPILANPASIVLNTSVNAHIGMPNSSVYASIKGKVPAGRFGEPVEIAKAVVFLASDEASYTVGSAIMIDGGMGTL